MALLKTRFPIVWTKLKEIEKNTNPKLVRVGSSENGTPNLIIKKGRKKIFLHDKSDPIREAELLIDQQQEIEDYSDILFYGIGLGYQINAFIKKYPGTFFSIYEPVPEIFLQFISLIDLTDLPLNLIKYLFIEDKPTYASTVANEFVGQIRDSACVIDFPAYKEIFFDKHRNFFIQFENAINERRSTINTTSAFEKVWTLNSMLNLNKTLSTPNILLKGSDCLKDKPAILVAAGPSLEDEIENLHDIKENGLAYIFSAGAAINTLIDHNIYPHAACTYDPTERNQVVFQKLIEKNIQEIPLIFGTSVGYATLDKYPGPQYHMLTSPDKVAPFYLKSKSGEILETINDAPSISVITLQLLIKLGFNPIILVGLNLAYKDNKQHAEGLDYSNAYISDKQLDTALPIEDVYGNEILSNLTYYRMRLQIEMYAQIYTGITIINTTRGGAKIKGTKFQHLDDLMDSILENRVYEESWLDKNDFPYDIKHLIKQYLSMNKAHKEMDKLLYSMHNFMSKINKQAEQQKFRNMEYMYAALDNVFSNLRANDYFKTIIMPMNQLADEVLQRAMLNINRENNNYKQAKMTVAEYEEYIFSCENDIQMIEPVFTGMNKNIESFIREHLSERAKKIKILVIEYERILTDGGLYYSNRGTEMVRLNSCDKTAVNLLSQQGINTFIITSQKHKRMEKVCEQLGIRNLLMGQKNKNLAVDELCSQMNVSYDEMACIINDINNRQLAGKMGLSFATNDAPNSVREAVDYVCMRKGGEGVLYEAAQVLLGHELQIHGTVLRS